MAVEDMEEAGVKGFYRLEKQFRNQKIEHIFKKCNSGRDVSYLEKQRLMFTWLQPRSRPVTHMEGCGLGEGNREQTEMHGFDREVLRGEEGGIYKG